MINRIIDRLYIGDAESVFKNINHFSYVDVRPCFTVKHNGDIEVDWDTIPNLISYILRLYVSGRHVCLFCNGGIDRSPFIAALFIYKTYHGMDLHGSYDLVREKNSQTFVHYEWITQYYDVEEYGIRNEKNDVQ